MVCVELTDKKQTKMRESWFPGLVVSPNAQVANIPYRDSVTRLLGGYFRSKLYFIVDCRKIEQYGDFSFSILFYS